jgi:nuclear pore complex protein Nup155
MLTTLIQLFNTYCDPAGYYDLCILIYQSADYRSPSDIKATWQNLIEQVHQATVENEEPQPFEAVSERVRSMGQRLNLSQSTFPIRKFKSYSTDSYA